MSRTFVAPAQQKSRCDIKFVKWLVRKNRALSMSKNDVERIGFYNLSCVEVIFKIVNQIHPWGDERIKKIVASLVVEGIKICISVDIWYSGIRIRMYAHTFYNILFRIPFNSILWSSLLLSVHSKSDTLTHTSTGMFSLCLLSVRFRWYRCVYCH
jgi:hypothetical protein